MRRFAELGLIVGLMSMFDGEGAPHLYLAHLPTQLVFVPKLTLLPILSRNDQLWLSIVRQMAAYQRQFLSSMADGLFQTLRVRLARAVVSLTRAYGTKAVGQQTIRIRLTQEDLGALLGVTRQSISKELRLLELEGVLRVGYGKLMVTDQDALGRVADEPATGGVLT